MIPLSRNSDVSYVSAASFWQRRWAKDASHLGR
jgi:hypothetical protein